MRASPTLRATTIATMLCLAFGGAFVSLPASAGTRLLVTVTPIDGAPIRPSDVAADARSAWLTVPAWLMTAVLHECANALVQGTRPSADDG